MGLCFRNDQSDQGNRHPDKETLLWERAANTPTALGSSDTPTIPNEPMARARQELALGQSRDKLSNMIDHCGETAGAPDARSLENPPAQTSKTFPGTEQNIAPPDTESHTPKAEANAVRVELLSFRHSRRLGAGGPRAAPGRTGRRAHPKTIPQ